MSTTNLQLESIELTDNMQTSFLDKMNNNFNKIDEAYGKLKEGLLKQTGKETLNEAINYIDGLANEKNELQIEVNELKSELDRLVSLGDAIETDIKSNKKAVVQGIEITGTAFSEITTATSNDIVSGKTAYDNEGNLITGNIKKMPNINITLTGNSTYMGYISGYGAGIDKDGRIIIWAMSNSTSYENINFVASSIGAGKVASGFGISSHDTGNAANVPHACIVAELSDYDTINITLNASTVNSSYDYVTLQVTLTAE